MTLRGLARGSVLYSIGFVLPRIGTFLLLPVYVRFLSTDEFGAISLVVSVGSLLAIGLRMGFDGALMRLYLDTTDQRERDRLVATLATFTAIVAGIGALVAALLSFAFFATLFTGLSFAPYGATAAALSFTITFQYLPATVFRAREEPIRFLAFTLGGFGSTAAVTVALLVAGFGVLGALLGQIAGGLFVVSYSAMLLWRSGGPRMDRAQLDAALSFGLPLVPHGLSGWVLNVSDRWLLGFLLAVPALAARSAIGVYSLGYQLAYAVDLLAQSFNAAWVPFFYRYGSTTLGPRIHREMTTIAMAGFGWLAAALSINAALIVRIIARPAFADAAALVPILSVGFVLHVLYIAVVTVIFHARRTRILPLITGAAAIVNVAVNAILIPLIGTHGAAWATLMAFAFMATATVIAARRIYPIRLDWMRLTAILAGVVGCAWFAATRDAAPAAPSVWLDIGFSLALGAGALLVALGPIRTLRSVTLTAAREGSR